MNQSSKWRAGFKVVQLNVDMDPGLRDQFAAKCDEQGVSRKEAIIRFITAWVTGQIQLP
jgi:hypothetical protein